MILGRGYGFLESSGGGVMEYPQRTKVTGNQWTLYSFQGIWLYCSSFALGIGFASLPVLRITWSNSSGWSSFSSISLSPDSADSSKSGPGPLLNPTSHCRCRRRRRPCLIHPRILFVTGTSNSVCVSCWGIVSKNMSDLLCILLDRPLMLSFR